MPSNTQECLLDAAEALFLERGYAATSLRSIAEQADVNLAATNYHFGSKHGLLEAIVQRRITPINDQRLAALDRLEARDEPPTVQEVIRAFVEPVLAGENTEQLPEVIGRLFSEPPAVMKTLIEKQFGPVTSRFTQALAQSLTDLPLEEIQWRFHFIVGAMLQTVKLPNPVGALTDTHRSVVLEQLVAFACAGIRAPSIEVPSASKLGDTK